jgi:hypothetical protein
MTETRTLPPNLPPSPPRWQTWLLGMVVADLAIGLLTGGLFGLANSIPGAQVLEIVAWPSFLLLPAFGGVLAAYVWGRLQPTIGETALNCLWAALLGLAGAAVVFREGTICLLIVSPLWYVLFLAGALLGRVWFRKADGSQLRVCLLPLLALLVMAEPFWRRQEVGMVRDELLIHAPPATVWPQVTAFGEIPAPADFWLFRLGLPYPVATTSGGEFVGAGRRCVFSGGAIFKETVAEWAPEQKLTFDIVEVPRDPELLGHLSPSRGQFLLRDNHDGTTTLIGTTWYSLHVRPIWYFDWWTEHIFRAVHRRVMEDVRRRAEAAPGPPPRG